MKNKSKIGLLGLTLDLYKKSGPQLLSKLKIFQDELSNILKDKDIDIAEYGPLCEKQELEHAFSRFNKEKVKGLIIVFLSYSPSLLILPFLKRFNKPVLIWNTQKLYKITRDFSSDDLIQNHGMHGVQDLASVLQRSNKEFTLITGHYKDKIIQERIKVWVRVCLAVDKLTSSRIGQIGGSFPLMGDFSISAEHLKNNLGVDVVPVKMEEIDFESGKVNNQEIKSVIKQDLKRFKASPGLSLAAHSRSIKLELALRQIIRKKNLQGIALNFAAFNKDSILETVPFLAVSKFLSEGLGYAGEGDTLSICSVLLLQYLTGEANFVEMFTMDFKNNLIFMNHMAESNPAMARRDSPIYIKENPLRFNRCKPTAVLSFTLRPGKATLINFTQTPERRIKIIMTRVSIIDRLPLKGIDSPHFFIKVHGKVEDFLSKYSYEGGTHHLALAYGDQREKIRIASQMLGLTIVEI